MPKFYAKIRAYWDDEFKETVSNTIEVSAEAENEGEARKLMDREIWQWLKGNTAYPYAYEFIAFRSVEGGV